MDLPYSAAGDVDIRPSLSLDASNDINIEFVVTNMRSVNVNVNLTSAIPRTFDFIIPTLNNTINSIVNSNRDAIVSAIPHFHYTLHKAFPNEIDVANSIIHFNTTNTKYAAFDDNRSIILSLDSTIISQ